MTASHITRCPPPAAPLAASCNSDTGPARGKGLTFWATAGDVIFRDHNSQCIPLPLAMTAGIQRELWRIASREKGPSRKAASAIYDQLAVARQAAFQWRSAAR